MGLDYPHLLNQNKDERRIKKNEPKYTNEEYLDLHGHDDEKYPQLKARITSIEYVKLPENKRCFYMRFCGHNEVYYTLNPLVNPANF